MYVIFSVRDNCPDEIKGVHHNADAAYKAFKQHLREAFQGEPMTEDDLDAACDLGYEPWGNGFIAILDLSNAEADNPSPLCKIVRDRREHAEQMVDDITDERDNLDLVDSFGGNDELFEQAIKECNDRIAHWQSVVDECEQALKNA